MVKSAAKPDIRVTRRRLLKRPKYRYMVVNRIVPHLAWMVLFALATFLYKARFYGDSAYYTLQFINNQNFWIGCQRIVAVIPQFIPMIGVWIGLEMKYILLLTSLSHVAFFYFLFLFVYYGLRDRRSGLLLILFQTIGILAGFFSPFFELYYGVAILITFYAIWRLPFRYNTIFILLILEVVLLLSHPFAIVLFVYLLLYDFVKKTAKPLKFYLPVIVLLILVIAFKAMMPCSYESSELVWQNYFTGSKQLIQLTNSESHNAIGMFLIRNYAEVLVALILAVFLLIKAKQWFRLALLVVSFFAFTLSITLVYSLLPSLTLEQMMYPIVPLVFIPLVYGFPATGKQGLLNISILLVSALILYRLAVIYYSSDSYMKRITQMEQLVDAARLKGGNKFMVDHQSADFGFSRFNWSYPIESMLLSAMDGNDIAVTITSDDKYTLETKNYQIRADQFITQEGELKQQKWLNKRYFHFDIGPYRMINDSTPNTNINVTASNLRITIKSKSIYQALDTVWIPVTLINRGKTPVFSGAENNVFVSYFWVKNNEVLNWNEIRTPLQADIRNVSEQFIKVAVPRIKGRMQLKADIIADGSWLGIYSQEDVLVY